MSMEFTLNDLQRQRVEDHLALVEQVLRRSIKTNETVDGMGHDDLYQEGCIALCRAAVSYGAIHSGGVHKQEPVCRLYTVLCAIIFLKIFVQIRSADLLYI